MADLSWKQNIIRAGAMQTWYVDERDGVHGALEFRGFPAIGQNSEKVQAAVERFNVQGLGDEAFKVSCKFVAEHIKEWSEAEPPTLENVLLLRPTLLVRVFKILCNLSASDVKPGDSLVALRSGDQMLGKS